MGVSGVLRITMDSKVENIDRQLLSYKLEGFHLKSKYG